MRIIVLIGLLMLSSTSTSHADLKTVEGALLINSNNIGTCISEEGSGAAILTHFKRLQSNGFDDLRAVAFAWSDLLPTVENDVAESVSKYGEVITFPDDRILNPIPACGPAETIESKFNPSRAWKLTVTDSKLLLPASLGEWLNEIKDAQDNGRLESGTPVFCSLLSGRLAIQPALSNALTKNLSESINAEYGIDTELQTGIVQGLYSPLGAPTANGEALLLADIRSGKDQMDICLNISEMIPGVSPSFAAPNEARILSNDECRDETLEHGSVFSTALNFNFNKDVPNNTIEIKGLLSCLESRIKFSDEPIHLNVIVEAYADSSGSAETNLSLSGARANSASEVVTDTFCNDEECTNLTMLLSGHGATSSFEENKVAWLTVEVLANQPSVRIDNGQQPVIQPAIGSFLRQAHTGSSCETNSPMIDVLDNLTEFYSTQLGKDLLQTNQFKDFTVVAHNLRAEREQNFVEALQVELQNNKQGCSALNKSRVHRLYRREGFDFAYGNEVGDSNGLVKRETYFLLPPQLLWIYNTNTEALLRLDKLAGQIGLVSTSSVNFEKLATDSNYRERTIRLVDGLSINKPVPIPEVIRLLVESKSGTGWIDLEGSYD